MVASLVKQPTVLTVQRIVDNVLKELRLALRSETPSVVGI
jgi:hypothetical protein